MPSVAAVTSSTDPAGAAAARTASSEPAGGRPAAGARSLGHQLERDRLERRAVRVRQVIRALRERAAARDAGRAGEVPRPLRAAIEDFGRELAELERRLREHRRPGLGA